MNKRLFIIDMIRKKNILTIFTIVAAIILGPTAWAQEGFKGKVNEPDSLGRREGFRIDRIGKTAQYNYYQKGILNGIHRTMRQGRLIEFGEYENGKMSGVWLFFDRPGHLLKRLERFTGNQCYCTLYYLDGRVKEEGYLHWRNGRSPLHDKAHKKGDWKHFDEVARKDNNDQEYGPPSCPVPTSVCVNLDPLFYGDITVFNKSGNTKLFTISRNNRTDEVYQTIFEILGVSNKMFNVRVWKVTLSDDAKWSFCGSGWIEKEHVVVRYLYEVENKNNRTKVYFFDRPNGKKFLVADFGNTPKILDLIVIDCKSNWLKVKTRLEGETYIGWIPPESQFSFGINKYV